MDKITKTRKVLYSVCVLLIMNASALAQWDGWKNLKNPTFTTVTVTGAAIFQGTVTITGTVTMSQAMTSSSSILLHDADTDSLSLDPSSLNVLYYRDGATPLFVVDSTGKVGIKVAIPTYELDVAGDIGVNTNIYHNGDPDTYINFTEDEIAFIVGNQEMLQLKEAATDLIRFNGQNNDVNVIFDVVGIEGAFFIEGSSGNLGVRTIAPQHLFSSYTSNPVWALTDTDVNTNVSSAAEAIDSSAIVLDVSGQPTIKLRGADGDAGQMFITTDDRIEFSGFSSGATFDGNTFTASGAAAIFSTVNIGNGWWFQGTSASGGIGFGSGHKIVWASTSTNTAVSGDTELNRLSANFLRTPDSLSVGGDLVVSGNVTIEGNLSVEGTESKVGEFYWNANGTATTMETANTPIGVRYATTGDLLGFTFDAGGTGAITAYADFGVAAGDTVTVSDASHGLATGDFVVIRGTTNYNGVWQITDIDGDSFYILDTWVADDGASDWEEPSYLQLTAGTSEEYNLIYMPSTQKAGGASATVLMTGYVNTTAEPKSRSEREFPGTDIGVWGGGCLLTMSAGDRFYLVVQSDNTNDLTYKYGTVRLLQE